MPKRKYTAEEIIRKFREVEVIIAAGGTVAEAVRRIGVSEQTFYRWGAEYGGPRRRSGCSACCLPCPSPWGCGRLSRQTCLAHGATGSLRFRVHAAQLLTLLD